MTPTIGLVIPCYNEQEVLRETTSRLLELLAQMQADNLVSAQSSIFYVDDGSRDTTWALIQELSAAHPASATSSANTVGSPFGATG